VFGQRLLPGSAFRAFRKRPDLGFTLLSGITTFISSALILCWSPPTVFPATLKPNDSSQTRSTSSPVYIVLWFDTEDYILPASDDAVMRIASFLSSEGVKATFKIVGEKSRTLERRGRQDVIAAIRQHDIGYHSNLHSQHPTPAERLSRMDWAEGVEEFDRTERKGFSDVQRIFGKPPLCYGQPGDSWAAQPYAALKRWGVSLYLDEGDHVGIHNQPFWYCGLLNVFKMREFVTRVQLRQESDLEKARNEFRAIHQKLQARGGGLVSIYYHPCEFVHQEFWDLVNFSNGMNPPPESWKLPPVKSKAETEQAFRNFKAYISFLKSTAGVEFVAANDLVKLYQDEAATRTFSQDEILQLSQAVQKEITFWTGPGFSVSPAEIFVLLNSALESFLENQKLPSGVKLEFAYGPTRRVERPAEFFSADWSQLTAACLDVQSTLIREHRIPNEVWIGSRALPPADYLATLGGVVEELIQHGKAKETVLFRPGNFTADQYVAEDSPEVWKWPIFPAGFHAPKIMELAKLQAWTLKPAMMSHSSKQ
jgi:hypothetical protein